MLVVVSDLHFEEEAANHIPGSGSSPPLVFQRNLPAAPFRLLIAQLAEEAVRNNAERLDFVLAGDIFDIHRTGLWFTANPHDVRPYQSTTAITPELEAMVLRIIQGIIGEQNVGGVLHIFQLLASGRYIDRGNQETPFPVPVELHYIPGNHDRMANGSPAIRAALRKALGLKEHGALFPYILGVDPEKVLIRHGHEYDFANFSDDLREMDTIPMHLPAAGYQEPTIGDFVTVDIAARLPALFREFHGEDKILNDQTLRALYLRLLEFDDLRPITAIFNYFLYAEGDLVSKQAAWQAIEPVIINLLEAVHDDSFLHAWLEKNDKKWRLDMIDAIQAILAAKPWRWTNKRIPLDLAETIAKMGLSATASRSGAKVFAAREMSIRSGQHRFLVAGHTHKPQVALIANDHHGERYYVDTGTWRNRVPATPDFKQFGRLKALNYVAIYGPMEDRGALPDDSDKIASFDFWSSTTQGWERDRLGIKPLDKTR